MGLPAKKRTPRSRDERRSHHALKKVSVNKCPKCGAPVKTHVACSECGTYKGRKSIDVEKRQKRTAKSKKALQ